MRWRLTFLVLVMSLVGTLFVAPAMAQDNGLAFLDDGSLAGRSIQLIILITLLSIVPGLAMMITCFPFIVTVLSILRQGLGLQQSPPNMLLVSLALFLTWFVMEPVFQEAWRLGGEPYAQGELELEPAFRAALGPFRGFMEQNVDMETVDMLTAIRAETPIVVPQPDAEIALSILVPSFLMSEIERAFQIGFLVFLPFLIIDLVVAAILMSMGMMMLSPMMISMPFKLMLFVLADGWILIMQSLTASFAL